SFMTMLHAAARATCCHAQRPPMAPAPPLKRPGDGTSRWQLVSEATQSYVDAEGGGCRLLAQLRPPAMSALATLVGAERTHRRHCDPTLLTRSGSPRPCKVLADAVVG